MRVDGGKALVHGQLGIGEVLVTNSVRGDFPHLGIVLASRLCRLSFVNIVRCGLCTLVSSVGEQFMPAFLSQHSPLWTSIRVTRIIQTRSCIFSFRHVHM
jgi:hypothetical protein